MIETSTSDAVSTAYAKICHHTLTVWPLWIRDSIHETTRNEAATMKRPAPIFRSGVILKNFPNSGYTPKVKIGTIARMNRPFTTWICAGRMWNPNPRFLSISDDSAWSVQVWPFD